MADFGGLEAVVWFLSYSIRVSVLRRCSTGQPDLQCPRPDPRMYPDPVAQDSENGHMKQIAVRPD